MSNKRKILVLGYFGYENNQLDGQTIKTRNIYDLLKLKETEEGYIVNYFDTQVFQKNKLNIFKMFKEATRCDRMVYIGARGNLTYFFPILFVLSKVFKYNIHYITIGGWLDEYSKKTLHFWMLKKIKGIYPETKLLSNTLSIEYKFSNVLQLNNFRFVDNTKINSSNEVDENHIKLVFMARVQPKKGISTLYEINDKLIDLKMNNVTIEIYGPIENSYSKQFKNELKSYKLINYKGALLPSEIHQVLCKYDLMLFPTKYYTEGFPGSILDAYLSGIPVVASNWKFAHEFIEDGISGIISEFNNEDDFVNKTIELIKDIKQLEKLKKKVKTFSLKFSSDAAWEIINKNILN